MMKKAVGIFIVSLVVFIICGCSHMLEKKDISDIEVVNKLYELNGTDIVDLSKVSVIIDTANNTEYKVENLGLNKDDTSVCLNVDFAVDNRANHRYIDENKLNRISGLIFALVKNADEILYRFYDDFSDKSNPDDAFYGAYYTKNNLCERINIEKMTSDYIENAADTIKTFEEYYKTIMSTNVAVADRSFLDRVYDFIGNDWEIVVNSSIGTELVLDDYDEKEISVISKNFSNVLGKYQAANIKAQLITYDIRNFKTDEYGKCVFVYYTHPDEGLIMIVSEFIDDERFEDIKEFIKNQQ